MPRKILVVDDNAINRQMLINVLSGDYDVIEAENGKEALALMHRYYKLLSAVMLDIMMPELDGYDVLKRVRENPLLSQLPIIMVTGSDDEDARVKALSLGANDFIQKPFNPEIVRHCLRNNITLRETASILNAIQRDKLTGLYNREAFFEKASLMISDKPLGTFILSSFDIDNFKLINDQYGAAEGDRILRDIGHLVKQNMEEIGGVAARISADNFAALFPVEHEKTDFLKIIQEEKLISLEQRAIVFSIGRYLINDTTLAASAIYDRAYLAKQSVKGRYDKHLAYFDQGMLNKLVRDQQIVSEMESALKERQFEVWFQPQYNHVAGSLTGAEALVRWRHPQKGLIPPGDFIPLFEQNGFVYELDKYVWRETCRYLRKWIDEGITPLSVSVNISRYDIFRADLIEVITDMVKEFEIPIELLRLEITESAFAKSTKLIVDIVKQLIALGFTIEIDDFGSGYSSLNTLKSVPAQVVKLDMRFLDDDEPTQRGGNILESIVRMTKWLGMAVIAEGVETKQQGDFLKSIGCSHVQGYLYARPMPAADYEALFKASINDPRRAVLTTAEHLNNDLFWNPDSLDSLIFNSYVGSACIYEYHAGEIELIRATDKFAHMLGGESMSVGELLALDIMDYLDKKTSAETLAEIDEAANTSGEVSGEFIFVDLPGNPGEVHIRSTMRVIASADGRYLIYCISENITAQRSSERAEARAARQLQVILDNVNCGITAVSLDGDDVVYHLANDKYFALLGYTKEQYNDEIGYNPYPMIIDGDRERVQAIVDKNRTSGKPASMEYRAVLRDNTIVWLRSFLSMTHFDGIDEPVQICTYADITAERGTAQNLLDNLPCGAGICVVSDDDIYMTYLNQRYLTYFKHNSASERSYSAFSVVHPGDHAALREAVRPVHEGGGGEGGLVLRIRDGEEYLSFRVSGVAVKNDSSDKMVYVTFVPISHEELSFSEMLPIALEKMMESSSDLSFVKDKNLRYICCSRAFANMAGLASERDVVGKTDYDLFEKKLADSYVSDDKQLIESANSIVDMVECIPSDNGRLRYSSTSKFLLYDAHGNVVGLYGRGYDITRSREAEEQQRFLINNIPGGVAICEGTWSDLASIRLSYFSDGFCQLFGYTREEYERLGAHNPTGLVSAEYISGLVSQIELLVRDGTPIDYIYRANTRDGGSCWIHIKAVRGETHGGDMSVNAVLFDVSEHQEALERLRVSEEENRLALAHSNNVVCRYDIKTKSLRVSTSGANALFEIGELIENIPEAPVLDGVISPETADVYTAFFNSILNGEKDGSALYQRRSKLGWRWLQARFSTIFSSDGAPVSAVVSFFDVTETLEKDVAYKKWVQTLHNKDPKTYSLFRCNVSRKTVYENSDGQLLSLDIKPSLGDFDEHASKYAEHFIFDEDQAAFIAFLDADSLLEQYFRGERVLTHEYREVLPEGGFRWMRLTADLVEYPHSTDIESYLLFENIDAAKRSELLTLERAQTDPLTGLCNRMTFAEKTNELIRQSGATAQHALLMLDIDGFKLVNDAFGHGAGDDALVEVAEMLRRVFRRGDIIGRLGGDEFVIFLNNIPDDRVAANKAKQLCELTRKAFSIDVRISASVGIARCPADGDSFELLYKKVDEALYHVKEHGRDNFAFYNDRMQSVLQKPTKAADLAPQIGKPKRRMLIVDDSEIDGEMLRNIFSDSFVVETVRDGASALTRLRHYGSAISVVLLDILMPGVDGFSVLERMQQSSELQFIPVVVVSGDDNRESSLRAIRNGAFDFVMKPVDASVLRIRVESAISKAENEKLRAKNSFLELRSAENARYQEILRRLGLGVVEQDWGTSSFVYSPHLSAILHGRFDNRGLWQILLTDMVADAETVKLLQQSSYELANDRERTKAELRVQMNAHDGSPHYFCVNIYKLVNEFGLTDKLLYTIKDIEDDYLS